MKTYNRDEERIINSRNLVNILKQEFLNKYSQDDLETKESLLKEPPGLANNLNLSQSEMAQLKLNDSVLSVLCGTLVGDGSLKLQKNYANPRFQYRHSTRQTEWFMWKTLGPLKCFIGSQAIQFQSPDGEQRKTTLIMGECLGKLKMSSLALPKLKSLSKIICENNQIVIKCQWLNQINAYFLMTLWLDDGSLVNRRQGYFCLYSTPESELRVLSNYIGSVWDIDCKVEQVPSKNNQFHIVISDQENLYKLMQVIAPLIPVKTMIYKVCFYPTNKDLLERWTTEIKTIVRKEWHEEIDKQYLYHAIRLTNDDSYSVDDIVQ